jgi:hypothetical protein
MDKPRDCKIKDYKIEDPDKRFYVENFKNPDKKFFI